MVNLGAYHVKTLDDGWTVVTVDGLPSAHFEHTVLTTEKGPEILTLPRPLSPPIFPPLSVPASTTRN
jgi:methionyl aminopeptidase